MRAPGARRPESLAGLGMIGRDDTGSAGGSSFQWVMAPAPTTSLPMQRRMKSTFLKDRGVPAGATPAWEIALSSPANAAAPGPVPEKTYPTHKRCGVATPVTIHELRRTAAAGRHS